MGLGILILGLFVFLGAHVFVSFRDARANVVGRVGLTVYRGVFALVSIAGLALIIWGYGLYRAHVVSAHPPPAISGRSLRLKYITQPKSRPPSFVVFCTRADAVPDGYKRYLLNSLRDTFELPGTPIRLALREKDNPYKGRAKRKH